MAIHFFRKTFPLNHIRDDMRHLLSNYGSGSRWSITIFQKLKMTIKYCWYTCCRCEDYSPILSLTISYFSLINQFGIWKKIKSKLLLQFECWYLIRQSSRKYTKRNGWQLKFRPAGGTFGFNWSYVFHRDNQPAYQNEFYFL